LNLITVLTLRNTLLSSQNNIMLNQGEHRLNLECGL